MIYDSFLSRILAFVIFFLPLHTALTIWTPTMGVPGTAHEGVWQYGVVALTLGDILLGSALGLFLWSAYKKRREHAIRKIEKYSAGGIGILIVLILLHMGGGISAAVYGVRMICAILLALLVMRTPLDVRLCAGAFVAAGVVQALLGIHQIVAQESFASSVFGIASHTAWQLGDAVVVAGGERWLRAYGTFPHPNVLAGFLSIAFVVSIYLAGSFKRHGMRRVSSICSLIICAGLFFTFSRHAWIAVIFVLGCSVFLFLSKIIDAHRWRGVLFFNACLFTLLAITFSGLFLSRIGVGGWHPLESRSLTERTTSLAQGVELVREFPLGVGLTQATWKLFEKNPHEPWYAYQPPHNLYLLSASEIGILGGLLLCVLLVFFFWKSLVYFFRKPTSESLLGVMCLALLIVLGMFDHYFWTLPTGIFLWWIVIAISQSVSREYMK